MTKFRRWLGVMVVTLFLVGCADKGRYHQHKDSAPRVLPQEVTTQDAVPTYVSYAPANMRPYTVRGIKYHPHSTAKGFSEEGYASWYGQKFHGHLTANGEIYDMFEMTAAHKTLPLPSFVRVTNLINDKQVIVRVNDRGPFHRGRVIDLSYAAALKLDLLNKGVKKVKVDVVHVDKIGKITIGRFPTIINQDTINTSQQIFIQVAALQDKRQIENLANGLKMLFQRSFRTKFEKGIYKLHLGPMKSEYEADKLLNELKSNQYPDAFKVYSD
jgi:rare lipoprotein A